MLSPDILYAVCTFMFMGTQVRSVLDRRCSMTSVSRQAIRARAMSVIQLLKHTATTHIGQRTALSCFGKCMLTCSQASMIGKLILLFAKKIIDCQENEGCHQRRLNCVYVFDWRDRELMPLAF